MDGSILDRIRPVFWPRREAQREKVEKTSEPTSVAPLPVSTITDPDWIAARVYIKDRIETHRAAWERGGLSHEEQEALRFAIAELKALLNFQKPSKMAGITSEKSD